MRKEMKLTDNTKIIYWSDADEGEIVCEIQSNFESIILTEKELARNIDRIIGLYKFLRGFYHEQS